MDTEKNFKWEKMLKFTQLYTTQALKLHIFLQFSQGFWGSFSYKKFSYKKTCMYVCKNRYKYLNSHIYIYISISYKHIISMLHKSHI